MKRDFLTTADFTRAELQSVLDDAKLLKADPINERLGKKTIALIFFNPSLRTRSSFDIGIYQMGGHAVTLEPGKGSWPMEFIEGVVMDGEAEEHVKEAARVLSRYCDIIAVRAFPKFVSWEEDREDHVIKAFAKHATVPVINMETITHPCQELALMLALQERLGTTDGKKFVLTWTYHPKPLNTAVANSGLIIAAKFGFDVTLLCPTPEYVLDERYMALARASTSAQGRSLTVTHDVEEAYSGAHVVYAKSWGALPYFGRWADEKPIRDAHKHFIVDSAKMALTDDGVFSHCLPAFSSTPPDSATEHAALRYQVTCADPDGAPVTLSIAPDDTCGGALVGDTYVLTPTERQGGSSCLLRILCSDGEAAEAQSSMLAIAEVNDAPNATNVAISPSPIPQPGDTLTCTYTFHDPEGDQDSSTVEWLVNGVAVATGPTFSDYQAGDSISCRVTPRDASLNGPPLTSPALIARDQLTVSAGAIHSCAIHNGALSCWGDNDDGQLGNGERMPNSRPPALVAGMTSGVSAVSTGSRHTCAIQRGALTCWGANTTGQLGDGTTMSRTTPTQVTGMTSDVSIVFAGDTQTCAIQRGALKCWGANPYGLIGDGNPMSQMMIHTTPTQIPGLISGVTAVSSGIAYTCAIHNGAAKCWGINNHGQLGDGTTMSRTTPTQVIGVTSGATAISAGQLHTCAIQNGALSCWGNNHNGRLGDGTMTRRTAPAQVVGMTSGISAVSAGDEHTCAIHNGAAKCWGANESGQLGDGSTTLHTTPTQVIGMTSAVSEISAKRDHTCAVSNSALSCWGYNRNGQLGTYGFASISPVTVATMSAPTAISVSAAHTCALQSGSLSCWGHNASGQLGDGTTTAQLSTHMPAIGMTADVSAVSAGQDHTCAIRAGALSCWGDNTYSQLGAMTSAHSTPAQVAGLSSGVSTVSTNARHTCAIQSGALKCWGRNIGFGQLGDGTMNNRSTPTQVAGMTTGVTAVSTGYEHTCAIQAGGLKCWGRSASGRLGDGGGAVYSATPAQVVGMTSDVTAVCASTEHTCAIQDGALYCWGRNASGRLGDGTTTDRATPTLVAGMSSGVSALFAGPEHTCAIQDSALYCWGNNFNGMLGDGTISHSATPVQVAGMASGVTAIAASTSHTCAIQGPTLKCWGRNNYGQLATPLIYPAPLPVTLP